MDKPFYPALFHKAEEGGFWISFPDIPECLTQGDNMAQAYEMAIDALGLELTHREKEHQELPKASDPAEITPEPDSFLVIVGFDMHEYKKYSNRLKLCVITTNSGQKIVKIEFIRHKYRL